MKIKVIVVLLPLLFVVFACQKDNGEFITSDGYIIGFDPVTLNHHYRIGYIFISEDLQDTLLTYNISDETFKMPANILTNSSDTLYQIPESYFANYRNTIYFPETARYKYKVRLTYTYAKENEKVINEGTTDVIFLTDLKQIIVHSILNY